MILVYLWLTFCLISMIIYVSNSLIKRGVFSNSSKDKLMKQDESTSVTSLESIPSSQSISSSVFSWMIKTRLGKWSISKAINITFRVSRIGKPKDTFTILSTGKAAKITYWRQGKEYSLYVPLRSGFIIEERFLYGRKKIGEKEVDHFIGKVDDVVCCFTPKQLGYEKILICDSDKTVLSVCKRDSIINPFMKKVSLNSGTGCLYSLDSIIGPVENLDITLNPESNVWFNVDGSDIDRSQRIIDLGSIFESE